MNYSPHVEAVGEYRDTTALSDKADDLDAISAADVKTLVGTLPDGVTFEGAEWKVDPARYDVVGKVSAEFKNAAWTNFGWWGYDYAEGEKWRKGLCYWQVPLSWVTLSLWSWVFPGAYPCKVTPGSEEDRKSRIVATLQKATKAAGGNLLIVTGFGALDFIHVQTGQVLSSTPAIRGEGLALRMKTASAPTAAPETQITDNDKSRETCKPRLLADERQRGAEAR